jgi:pre-mRNA cleavage complex 2 protein Pcf11
MDYLFLLQNASNQKLPVIYLVDSICKNVGEPYIQLFARNIASLFLESYARAEVSTRRSFERLLQTWKNGMPDGRPVFSRSVLEPIERSVKYLQEQSPQQQRQPPPQQAPNIMVCIAFFPKRTRKTFYQ